MRKKSLLLCGYDGMRNSHLGPEWIVDGRLSDGFDSLARLKIRQPRQGWNRATDGRSNLLGSWQRQPLQQIRPDLTCNQRPVEINLFVVLR